MTLHTGARTGFTPTREDEGREIVLTEDFGTNFTGHHKCSECGRQRIEEEFRHNWFEGFRKGTTVRIERVEESRSAVHAMGHYEGTAHVTTVELRNTATGEILTFRYENLKIPA